MAALAHFYCQPNSHPFQERQVPLNEPTKIGRSVARCRPSPNNAVFDCKVLSRNHALLWFESGKFYLQDTKSSNGTFINNQRLSKASEESAAVEVNSYDIVQFGVDVVDSMRKVTHGCIVSQLRLYLPNGEESPQRNIAWNSKLIEKIPNVYPSVQSQDLYQLHHYLQEAHHREQMLEQKLALLQRLLLDSQDASDKSWQALIDEDRLLSRLEFLENQLQAHNKTETEDSFKIQLQQMQEEKYDYENTSKETLRQALQEKLEVVRKLSNIERSLSNSEDECTHLRHIHEQTQSELLSLTSSHHAKVDEMDDMMKKLQEVEQKHIDSANEIELQKCEIEKKFDALKMEEEKLRKNVISLEQDNQRLKEISESHQASSDIVVEDIGVQVEENEDKEFPILTPTNDVITELLPSSVDEVLNQLDEAMDSIEQTEQSELHKDDQEQQQSLKDKLVSMEKENKELEQSKLMIENEFCEYRGEKESESAALQATIKTLQVLLNDENLTHHVPPNEEGEEKHDAKLEEITALGDASAGDSEEVKRVANEELLETLMLMKDQENKIRQLQDQLQTSADGFVLLETELESSQSRTRTLEEEADKHGFQFKESELRNEELQQTIASLRSELSEERKTRARQSSAYEESRECSIKQAVLIESLQKKEQEVLDELEVTLQNLHKKEEESKKLEDEVINLKQQKEASQLELNVLNQSFLELKQEKNTIADEHAQIKERQRVNEASLEEEAASKQSLQETFDTEQKKWENEIFLKDEKLGEAITRCQQLIQEREASALRNEAVTPGQKWILFALLGATLALVYFCFFTPLPRDLV